MAHPVRNYMVNTLHIPLQAATAREEEGLDDFDNLVNMDDDQVLGSSHWEELS
jgi:hypothetical protein